MIFIKKYEMNRTVNISCDTDHRKSIAVIIKTTDIHETTAIAIRGM